MSDERTPVDDLTRLAALHKHWVTADSVNYHLRRSVRTAEPPKYDVPESLADLAQHLSVFGALSVWYSLLQVVVEGYGELGYQDPLIDPLLAQEEYTTALRRFRNATFHYQADPISPKLLAFLIAKDSEVWVNELSRAFCQFFEEKLKIKDMLARLGETIQQAGSA